MAHRIIKRMKVTALIPDELVSEAKMRSHSKNVTETIIVVMKEWLATQRLRELTQQIQEKPFQFREDFSAEKVRALNREIR